MARATERIKAAEPYKKWIEKQRTPEGKALALFGNARSRARREARPFDIAPADIVIPRTCPLLGIALKFDNPKPLADSPTLDCIEPQFGYVPGNVWVISFKANTIKSNASVAELEALVANLRLRLPK